MVQSTCDLRQGWYLVRMLPHHPTNSVVPLWPRWCHFQFLFGISKVSIVFLFLALDSKSEILKKNINNNNKNLKAMTKNESCTIQRLSLRKWAGITFSPSCPPSSLELLMDWRSQLVRSYWVLPDGSPHRGSENLFAVSSFNEFQQTRGQQITQDDNFLWCNRGNSWWQRLDVEEIFKLRAAPPLE